MSITYKDVGVDLDTHTQLLQHIDVIANTTTRSEVISHIGGFAGSAHLPASYRQPVLLSSTDGVGTKLNTAIFLNRHHDIGLDLVAMVANDILAAGGQPFLFLDYFATETLNISIITSIMKSIAQGCLNAGCIFLGGETAQMPNTYQKGKHDIAGFCVGIAEAETLKHREQIDQGDVVIGIASSGLHANGHSLARAILFDTMGLSFDSSPVLLNSNTIADELVRPTYIYKKCFDALKEANITIHGAAHITGGGIQNNANRTLPDSLSIIIEENSWDIPPIFSLIQQADIDESEYHRVFNRGIGMIIVCSKSQETSALKAIKQIHDAWIIGSVEKNVRISS